MENDLFAGLELLLDAHPMPPGTGLKRSVFLSAQTLTTAARRMVESGYHLEDISGLDCTEGILVNYHFDRYDRSDRIVLRVLVSHGAGKVPSIASAFGGAEWHEREVNDFFGVIFEGNPNPAPLLLPPEDTSRPLRKEPQARRALRDLIDPGPVVFQAPGFDLFLSDGPSGAPVGPAQGANGEAT